MVQRVIQIRKKAGLNQEQFSKKLGLSRNFINQFETGKKNMSDRTISDICRIFNVNEQWLRTGEGDMFNPSGEFDLCEFAQSHGATESEFQFLKAYFELDCDIRRKLIQHFKNRMLEDNESLPSSVKTKTEPSESVPTDLTARLDALERETERVRRENAELRQKIQTMEEEGN